MGLQLLLCVETNKKTKSDYIYIREAVFCFYDINQAHTRIRPIYMNGKGNYQSNRVVKEIQGQTNQYAASANGNQTIVVYCIDCDRYDTEHADFVTLNDIKEYCDSLGYEFVWFCRDSEHVFLGRQVEDNQKKREAESFEAHKKILHFDPNVLRAKKYRLKRSNLCIVLDKYL